jgi:hypothetical protein
MKKLYTYAAVASLTMGLALVGCGEKSLPTVVIESSSSVEVPESSSSSVEVPESSSSSVEVSSSSSVDEPASSSSSVVTPQTGNPWDVDETAAWNYDFPRAPRIMDLDTVFSISISTEGVVEVTRGPEVHGHVGDENGPLAWVKSESLGFINAFVSGKLVKQLTFDSGLDGPVRMAQYYDEAGIPKVQILNTSIISPDAEVKTQVILFDAGNPVHQWQYSLYPTTIHEYNKMGPGECNWIPSTGTGSCTF